MLRVVVIAWVLLVTGVAGAERLPVRVFTTADGLANNRVERGTEDTNGFLWFCTGEGVSRFDGRRFESFGVAEGLPGARCHDILATRDGRIWVGTESGLAVLERDARVVRPRFQTLTSTESFRIAEDPSGVVWVGTTKGLLRIERGVTTEIALPAGVLSIAYDPKDRSLWLATMSGLMHRTETGAVVRYRIAPRDEADDRTFGVLLARDGTLWVGHGSARVLRITLPLAPTPAPLAESSAVTVLATKTGARRNLLQDSTGAIWIGTYQVLRWDGARLEELPPDQLGSEDAPSPSLEDSAGNLWFGTDAQGVIRVAKGGLSSYGKTDGLISPVVFGFVQDAGGPLYAVPYDGVHHLARRDGERFTSAAPPLPPEITHHAWTYGQVAAHDRDGRWWLPSGDGVVRYPATARFEDLATATPTRITDLPGRDISRIYEDRRGDVWITTMSEIGTARWDRATDRIITLTDDWAKDLATAFAEDANGDLWISLYGDSVVRIHDGVAKVLAHRTGGTLETMILDHRGRMWLVATGVGVVRFDDPAGAVSHVYAPGVLGSQQLLCVVEDRQGRIYVGTSRGIARIDPETDEIVHFGIPDGLPNDYIQVAFRDEAGTLWFGTKFGLARLSPEASRPPPPARVFVLRLSVAGTPQPIAAGGEEHIGPLELASDETSLDLDVASPQLAIGSDVRFQYRLDDRWSDPTSAQTLHFARLAPGHYDLAIRAIDAHGTLSPAATVEFRVLAPLWRRWWFIALVALSVGALAFAWYRRRLAHQRALERVRRRIASDLHDELGSSLSRISILSEVARSSTDAPGELGDQLDTIGTSARELVDVARDIVWSTDPRRDDLGSLLVRLRSFASDLLEARGIGWSIKAPAEPEKIKLDPERRRHVYLVLKEAITNAAKHSGATRVDVSIGFESSGFVARVRDNGAGFTESDLPGTGNGLSNMRARAEEAGGTLEIRGGQGTEIILRL